MIRAHTTLLASLLTLSCGGVVIRDDGGIDTGDDDAGAVVDADAGTTTDAGSTVDAGVDAGAMMDAGLDAGMPCPAGMICVDRFPFTNTNDTSTSTRSIFDHYSCAPATNESGNERVYRVEVPAPGFLSAAVYETSGVDVDVHILSALDSQACVSRGNLNAKADVTAGTWFVVVDTWVSAGVPQAGPYRVDIGFIRPSEGGCALNTGTMSRVNDMGNALAMPATGKIVMEAHLVTQAEPPPYPASFTDELEAHGTISQARTGFVMHRTQPWAPLEGGAFYGAGIGSPTLFPVEDEGWYVNMYWTSAARPARGTRMIFREPGGSRAVVVSAGYETGPGDLTWVGGTPEETHFYMGTTHGSILTLGIATDQSLPLGPRVCTP
jgi:hypothetical protein